MNNDLEPTPEFERLAESLRCDRPTVPVIRGNFVPSTAFNTAETERPDAEEPVRTDGSTALQGANVSPPRALDELPPALRAKVERMRNL
ncbi:hypothetical protein KA047_03630 [Candidatus Saccharibacteria bacterium]|nr:hypothetical protein [Candidatus Saccharibacteria bacterium]